MSYEPDVVPQSRTLTINGVGQNLQADRSWAVTPVAGFIQTALSTPVVGTDPETTIVGTGTGSLNIAAGTLVAGSTIRVNIYGQYNCSASGATLNFKAYLNANEIVQTQHTLSALNGANKLGVYISFLLTVLSTATSSDVQPGGNAQIEVSASTGARSGAALNNNGAPFSSIDTTIIQALDVTLTWGGGADGTCSLTTNNMTMEVLNTL